MFEFSAEAGLWGLFIASFVAASLLPGGSELVLLAVLHRHPALLWPALAVAKSAGSAARSMSRP